MRKGHYKNVFFHIHVTQLYALLIGISVTALPSYAEEAKLQTKSINILQQAEADIEKEGRNYSYSEMTQEQERVKRQPGSRQGGRPR